MDSAAGALIKFPATEIFHTRNTVAIVGQNPRWAYCVTPSRRFRYIDDAELRGGFLENSVTEEAMAAKLKVGPLKIIAETWP
jgi:hypothetical protein